MKTRDGTHNQEGLAKLVDLESFRGYDFLDLGAGKGDSLESCEKRIGGKGLGVDNDPEKIRQAAASGRNVVLGGALDIRHVTGAVSYVVCDNFLEHLPSFADVDAVLEQAAAVATDYIYIRHPSFEDMDYLKELGLKTFWTDWKAHPSMLRVADILDMLRKHGIYTVKTVPVMRITDSDDPNVLPVEAPPGQHHYRSDHGQKPQPPIEFERDIFYAFDIVAMLPDSEAQIPMLNYKDKEKSEKRPTFHSNRKEQRIQELQEDIAALQSRKSIRITSWLSRKLKQ